MKMNFPKELKYQKTDEWVRVSDGIATLGISDFAQNQLSDLVYVEITCDIGDKVTKGDTLGIVESVKAAADINFPVSGEVIEINAKLSDNPETLNNDPYGEGWMVKVKLSKPEEMDKLMDSVTYQQNTLER
jgi:glycine cleavage system H protein